MTSLAEIEDVLHRPEILHKFPLIESEDSQTLLRTARNKSLLLADVPNAFQLPRDPDDEPYTDLAIAADAKFLGTWNDRHLTGSSATDAVFIDDSGAGDVVTLRLWVRR
jgi:predicted nucleic acid-binding protein